MGVDRFRLNFSFSLPAGFFFYGPTITAAAHRHSVKVAMTGSLCTPLPPLVNRDIKRRSCLKYIVIIPAHHRIKYTTGRDGCEWQTKTQGVIYKFLCAVFSLCVGSQGGIGIEKKIYQKGWRKIDPRADYSGSENLIKTAFFNSFVLFLFVFTHFTLDLLAITESLSAYTHKGSILIFISISPPYARWVPTRLVERKRNKNGRPSANADTLYLWVTGLLKRVAKVMCRTCHSRVFGLNIYTYIRIGGGQDNLEHHRGNRLESWSFQS